MNGPLDFYELVRVAESSRQKTDLLSRWNADPRLHIKTGRRHMRIRQGAFRSLEHILRQSKRLNREIPFTCLVNEPTRTVMQIFKGVPGEHGICDWEKGTLLPQSFSEARRIGLKVILGHTHPEGFGAICSAIYDKKTDPFGGDYLAIRAWTKKTSAISRYHIIMSPQENQIGVFSLGENGVTTYVPWKKVNA